MGVPGPKPKPPALKLLEGNPGHRPINENQPKPRPVAPKCPSWLATEARKEWRRVAPELERMGLLSGIDRAALAAYCQAYARWREAEETIDRLGLTFRTNTGYEAPRPEVTIARQMMVQMRAFCVEFGLTPSSRGRMTLPEVPDDEDNPFDV